MATTRRQARLQAQHQAKVGMFLDELLEGRMNETDMHLEVLQTQRRVDAMRTALKMFRTDYPELRKELTK